MAFVLSLFHLTFPSFGASGKLCFVIVAFSEYLWLYFSICNIKSSCPKTVDLFQYNFAKIFL